MSNKYISKDSQTDWQRITTMQDEDIDLETILRRVIREELHATD